MKGRDLFCRIPLWMFTLLGAALLLTRLLGIRIYAVASGSMEPAYQVGGLIFVRKTEPEKIREGDCITYLFQEKTITHRVQRIDRDRRVFLTKGDGNAAQDAPVPFSALVGKASSFAVPLLGYGVIWLKGLSWWEAAILMGGALALTLIWDIVLIGRLRRRRKRREAS